MIIVHSDWCVFVTINGEKKYSGKSYRDIISTNEYRFWSKFYALERCREILEGLDDEIDSIGIERVVERSDE